MASEILRRGGWRSKPRSRLQTFSGRSFSPTSASKGDIRQADSGAPASLLRSAVPWHHYGLLALEQTQLSLRSPYLDNDLVRTAFRAPKTTPCEGSIFTDAGDCVRWSSMGRGSRADPDRRGLAGNHGPLCQGDHAGFSSPLSKAEYAYDYGMPSGWPRPTILYPRPISNAFPGRHKFNHFRVWYRDCVSDYFGNAPHPRALCPAVP